MVGAEAEAQAALVEGSAEGLARVAVEVAVAEAQAPLEGVAQAGPARAARQERAAAVQATVDQVPVGRAAEDPVPAAGEGNPVNGWRLRPCCAAPRRAGWGEQEASAPA